jgi:hypothetical protein
MRRPRRPDLRPTRPGGARSAVGADRRRPARDRRPSSSPPAPSPAARPRSRLGTGDRGHLVRALGPDDRAADRRVVQRPRHRQLRERAAPVAGPGAQAVGERDVVLVDAALVARQVVALVVGLERAGWRGSRRTCCGGSWRAEAGGALGGSASRSGGRGSGGAGRRASRGTGPLRPSGRRCAGTKPGRAGHFFPWGHISHGTSLEPAPGRSQRARFPRCVRPAPPDRPAAESGTRHRPKLIC